MAEWKAMIYNMHHGKAADGTSNLERIAGVIRESGADIVGFNEVDRFFSRRSGFADQFEWLRERLDMNGVFGPALTRKKGNYTGEYGNALFSRFPIRSHANHGLRSRRLRISEPRSLLEADIELPSGLPLKVFLTHLSVIPVLRRIQAGLVAERIGAAERPAILLGDLNLIPHSAAWRRLSGVLDDAAQRSLGISLNTFPSIFPATQKDYIFVHPEVRVRDIDVFLHDRHASDHLPLLATLAFEPLY